MEHIKSFLDTSTIHGLSWISSSRKWQRLFWTLVVLGGFTGAAYLIHESFYNWKQNPISTTVETLPISQITFPNVTICPPTNSYLNLNYDLMKSTEMNLDNVTRSELLDDAIGVIHEEFCNELMTNLSKVEDSDRYYNWYHGYSKLRFPYHSGRWLVYNVETTAISGNISSIGYGTKFDADKLDGMIDIRILVYKPLITENIMNTTLMINIEKKTIKDYSEKDELSLDGTKIDADLTYFNKNITGNILFRTESFKSSLIRRLKEEDLNDIDLDEFPGFQLSWHYNYQLENWPKYTKKPKYGYDATNNLEFVR